ncbi:MAG TPA: hypothetical protein PKK26_05775, partial [Candidatus Wallbacteria bacterium]|nr:hypothetical protein [Candidatus Wallbacteria bacterium]
MKNFLRPIVFALILSASLMCASYGDAASSKSAVSTYDPATLYKLGLAWDYPPYLMVDIPASPGDAIFSQGPFPYIAPVMQKSGWITGHAAIYAGRKDNNNDGIEEYVTAESARFGVWYGYFYPMRRFEKGHGKMEDSLKKDTTFSKTLKKLFGDNVAESAAIKKYDELLDGTYMGARNVDLLTESPDEFVYRRKILEFSHNYILKNSDYNYEGFSKPITALFFNKNNNTYGTGGYGKGHGEKFTCVGLVEAAYEYAGIDLVPRYIEETNLGLTPLKQFLYTKPISKLFVKKGESVTFEVWHVVHGHRTFENPVKCEPIPAGCSFDGKAFTVNSASMNTGTYEIEFASVNYPDQRQKIKIFITSENKLPNFDFKNVAVAYKGLEKISDSLKADVEKINGTKSYSKKEHDQKLLAMVLNCANVDDAVYIVRNIQNGGARDIALLYSLRLANDINDLYKLSMFTDSSTTINKILYSPVGYKLAGIDNAMKSIINASGFSLLYNMKCKNVLKDALKGDYVFDHSTNLNLKITFADVSKLDVSKIVGFISYLCQNPKEINKLENGYLIDLIQKRAYFGIANGEAAADDLRKKVDEMYKKSDAAAKQEKGDNQSNIISDQLVVARFLYSMTKSLDTEGKWLKESLAAEK